MMIWGPFSEGTDVMGMRGWMLALDGNLLFNTARQSLCLLVQADLLLSGHLMTGAGGDVSPDGRVIELELISGYVADGVFDPAGSRLRQCFIRNMVRAPHRRMKAWKSNWLRRISTASPF